MIFSREIFKSEKGEFVEYFNVCFRTKWILILKGLLNIFLKLKVIKKSCTWGLITWKYGLSKKEISIGRNTLHCDLIEMHFIIQAWLFKLQIMGSLHKNRNFFSIMKSYNEQSAKINNRLVLELKLVGLRWFFFKTHWFLVSLRMHHLSVFACL